MKRYLCVVCFEMFQEIKPTAGKHNCPQCGFILIDKELTGEMYDLWRHERDLVERIGEAEACAWKKRNKEAGRMELRCKVKYGHGIGPAINISGWEEGVTAFKPGKFGVYREGQPPGYWGLEKVIECPVGAVGDTIHVANGDWNIASVDVVKDDKGEFEWLVFLD